MNANLSQQMSLLGVAALLCYTLLLSAELVTFEVMPQFIVSALIFITSGRLLRARGADNSEDEAEKNTRPPRSEADWHWLSLLLNWCMSLLVLGIMALWLMKPIGLDLLQAVQQSTAHDSYFSGYVP
jgi:hypothetical protein